MVYHNERCRQIGNTSHYLSREDYLLSDRLSLLPG